MKNRYFKIGLVALVVLVLLSLAYNIDDVIRGFNDAVAGR